MFETIFSGVYTTVLGAIVVALMYGFGGYLREMLSRLGRMWQKDRCMSADHFGGAVMVISITLFTLYWVGRFIIFLVLL